MVTKAKNQNVLWSRLPTVSWRFKGLFVSQHWKSFLHLLSWEEELAEKGEPHRSKTKLEGAKKENENEDDQNVVAQNLGEEGAAKDQSVGVGGDPEYGGKDDCSEAHAGTTEDKEDFSGGWKRRDDNG